ncbi:MAG: hypothetical protein HY899_00410, partial [Deltaproteobacteria bacterium]|nr:hypothetical protein [Deltaproteobacteria bacterium]
RTRLRHRLGHQAMTVLEFARASAAVTGYDLFGNPTMAPTASLIEVSVQRGDQLALDSAGDNEVLRLLFAVPEAVRR